MKMYTTKNDAALLSQCHEYALAYMKSTDSSAVQLLPRTDEMDARYTNPDNDPRGPWKAIPLYAKGERKNGRYAIVSPATGKEHWPGPDSHWLYVEADTKKMIDENRIRNVSIGLRHFYEKFRLQQEALHPPPTPAVGG